MILLTRMTAHRLSTAFVPVGATIDSYKVWMMFVTIVTFVSSPKCIYLALITHLAAMNELIICHATASG